MIAHLSGTLLFKQPDSVVVDVAGVGYLVHIPFSTFYALAGEGTRLDLFVHTHVREDSIALYGFLTPLEKELFEELIGVTGIGPKVATTILSGMGAEEFIQAIRSEDRRKLQTIPGLGKKTTERVLLELREKFLKKSFAVGVAPSVSPAGEAEDVISALQNLGFRRPEAAKAVERALVRLPVDRGFETVLKAALRYLTG